MKVKNIFLICLGFVNIPLLASDLKDTKEEHKPVATRLDALNVQANMSPLDIEKQSKSISVINKESILEDSGTGGVQNMLGRKFIGIEKDASFIDILIKRKLELDANKAKIESKIKDLVLLKTI
ncbi:hypothetical protein BKH43_01315 [Helicobacter sp. 13S00401-1]|nr:hypothetical protein BKH43_01315 [Helicobacter sp. 13S00401-1]